MGHWSSCNERKNSAKKVTHSSKNDAKGYRQYNKTNSSGNTWADIRMYQCCDIGIPDMCFHTITEQEIKEAMYVKINKTAMKR